ncbi:MAG: DUF5320 domain-containing protein [Spirochaetia bacterium]|nr:DUF5320 domain-containing protein [Spirochaetia bacterium]
MPGMNRTGPEGLGPMTGRGMGACGGDWRSRQFCRGRGFGMGGGRTVGPGRGLGWFNAGVDPSIDGPGDSIKGALEQKAAFLRSELARIDALLASSSDDQAKDTQKGEQK